MIMRFNIFVCIHVSEDGAECHRFEEDGAYATGCKANSYRIATAGDTARTSEHPVGFRNGGQNCVEVNVV